MSTANSEQIAIDIVGSSSFGLYPKISLQKTYNMFISDDWLVNYAGFQAVSDTQFTGKGRGLFRSIRGNFMLAVIGGALYKIKASLAPQFIANLSTTIGFVSMDENLAEQICIVDGVNAYIYHYPTETLTTQALGFVPNYVAYHNSFFLIASAPQATNPQNWYVYQRATDTTISQVAERQLQTKPDVAWAIHRLPGRGNNIIVFGKTVAEIWTNTAESGQFIYTRVSSYNIDNGCVSVATIAASEEFIVWLGQNENNSPSIMMTNGGETTKLSSDGIDNVLQDLEFPEQSIAFFYRQDGHLFYQITFYNEHDNLSLIYDFNTQKFFHVSDEDLNYHPARQVVYFRDKTYFVSLNDNFIYEMSTNYVTYNYAGGSTDKLITEDDGFYIVTEDGLQILDETGQSIDIYQVRTIPRIRICKSVRRADSSVFRVGHFVFWIEQGVNNFLPTDECGGQLITEDDAFDIITEDGIYIIDEAGGCIPVDNRPRVDMSFSKNGNQSFSNVVSRDLNAQGHYRNIITWHRMGMANEFTIQLRFWGLQRFVANNGIIEIY